MAQKPEEPPDPPTLVTSVPEPPDTLVQPALARPSTRMVTARPSTPRLATARPAPPSTPPAPPAREGVIVADDPTTVSSHYLFGEVLGRGGMGEVLLAHDRRIGRDVAVKRLRSGSPAPDDIARFLREARIQARLAHPAIVPVYELGRDPAGRAYFTMKRLSGTTLSDLLAGPGAPRQRLLRGFTEVCRAVDFAHSRGVVHRDLKPANIVLGEFGEVYVLDWGVARVLGDVAGGVGTADIDTLEGAAPEGQVLGTPGYMAPEQLQQPEVGRPADVYALGAILFELLTGEPLHPRATAVQSTLGGAAITSPAARRPDRAIPPELDALCTAMLTSAPQLRPTARRCADGIEQYLDGDRDVARRGTMAGALVEQARAALDAGLRAEAMRAAGRALALDPSADGAAELVIRLMLEPPRQVPPELREELRRTDAEGTRRHARSAIFDFLLIAGFLPIIVWNGVLRWPLVIAETALALVMALAAWRLLRAPHRSVPWMAIYSCGAGLLLGLLSRISGSFTFVSAIACFISMSVVTYPAFLRRPWVVIGTTLGGFVIPIVLEATGVITSTWHLIDGAMVISGDAVQFSGTISVVSIVAATSAAVVMAGVQSVRLARANREAQHRLVIQAWHLRQLLPAPAAPAKAP